MKTRPYNDLLIGVFSASLPSEILHRKPKDTTSLNKQLHQTALIHSCGNKATVYSRPRASLPKVKWNSDEHRKGVSWDGTFLLRNSARPLPRFHLRLPKRRSLMTRRDQELLDKQLSVSARVQSNGIIEGLTIIAVFFGWHSHRRYSVFGTKQADKNYVA